MGWRCHLSIKKGEVINCIADKKNVIPNEWLMLFSSQDYKEDYHLPNVINPRFEADYLVITDKMNHYGVISPVWKKIEEDMNEGDILILEFGEIVDNGEFSEPVSKEHYFMLADAFHQEYLSNK